MGAGHAHLYLLKRIAAFRAAGADVTVLAPDDFQYSGLATGMVGGRWTPEQDRVALAPLLAGATWIRDRAVAIDRNCVHCAAGEPVRFDLLSLDLGSEVAQLPGLAVEDPRNFGAKPIAGLVELRRRIEAATAPLRVLVAGSGASAIELAANLANHASARVTLAAAHPGRTLPRGAASYALRKLAARGVTLHAGDVTHVDGGHAWTTSGVIGFDLVIRATGLVAPALLAGLDLPLQDGALVVGDDLAAPGDARIHAAGDCAAVAGERLPMIGVHAVRQAPVLFDNLLARLRGAAPVRRYRAQRHALLILNLGDGTGLALRGRLWLAGRAMRWLKDRIDQGFLARYR